MALARPPNANANAPTSRARRRASESARGDAATASTSTEPMSDLEGALPRPPLAPKARSLAREAQDARAMCAEYSCGATSRRDVVGSVVGRREVLERARAHCASAEHPNVLLIEGERGSGTSAVLGDVCRELRRRAAEIREREEVTGVRESEKAPYVAHVRCRGSTPGEADLRHVLSVACERMRDELGDSVTCDAPTTVEEAGRTLNKLMEELAATRVVVLVVDELDDVEGLNDVPVEDWLPSSMMMDIRVILAVKTKGPAFNYLSSAGERAARFARKRVSPLGVNERAALARGLFQKDDERDITAKVFEQITSHKDASSPTYLYLAAHELRRRIKISRRKVGAPFDAVHEIRSLPETTEQLVEYIFDGLEQDHGSDPVRQLMTVLASSRAGVSPNETAEIMGVSSTSVSFQALTDDVAHMLWCYEEGSPRAASIADIMVLRLSQISEYVRARYLLQSNATEAVQRSMLRFFLKKLAASGADYDSRSLFEVLHITRNGAWKGAREQFLNYMADPEILHYCWTQNASCLCENWRFATANRDESTETSQVEKLIPRLAALESRALEQCASSVADFFSWIGADNDVILVCRTACDRSAFQLHVMSSLNLKYARALRRVGDWQGSIDRAKEAFQLESANFQGNTPVGARILNEESLAWARTKGDNITLDVSNLLGSKDEIEEALSTAIESAESSLNAWRVCTKDRNINAKTQIVSVTLNVATLYGLTGSREKEIKIHEKLISELEKTHGANNVAVYHEVRRMAEVYTRHAEWVKAEICLEQALQFSIEAYPDKSLELFNNVLSLARMYRNKGDLTGAKEVYEDLIRDVESVTDSKGNHTLSEMLATIYGDFARVLRESQEKDAAKQMYIKALNLTKTRFGEMYHGTAERLSELASFHLEIGNTDQAKALFTRALEIDTHLLGENHPGLAAREMDVARAMKATGETAEMLRRLKVAETLVRGTNEAKLPDLAERLNTLADLYKEVEQEQRAEPLYVRAVSVAEQSYRSYKNLDVYLSNVAQCYKAQNRLAKARTYFEQALKVAEEKYRPNSLDLAKRCVALGEVLFQEKLWGEALPCYTRAKDIRHSTLGPDHAETRVVVDALKAITRELEKASVQGKVGFSIAERGKTATDQKETAQSGDAPQTKIQESERKPSSEAHERTRDNAVLSALERLEQLTKTPEKKPAENIVRALHEEQAAPPLHDDANPAIPIVRERQKKPDVGDINGFLTEFVQYVGDGQYKFTLDGSMFKEFSSIRVHVENNFADECGRWTRGELIDPSGIATTQTNEAALDVERTRRESQKPGEQTPAPAPKVREAVPSMERTFSKPPIVESPQSESTGNVTPDVTSQMHETTPQSMNQTVNVTTDNQLVTLPVQERDYMLCKINVLETELAVMRDMMQRMLRERTFGPQASSSNGPDTRQNGEPFGPNTGYYAPPTTPSYLDTSPPQQQLYRPKRFALLPDPRKSGDESPSSPRSPRDREHEHANRKSRLIRLDAARATQTGADVLPASPPKRNEKHFDHFVSLHSERVAPGRYQCSFDGVTLSSASLMRAHFERAHAEDAKKFSVDHLSR